MRLGRTTALVGTVALSATLLVSTPTSAGAQVPTDFKLVAGNFVGDARDELFVYTPGPSPELLVGFFKDQNGMLNLSVLGEFTVNKTFTPLAGDFDGDGHDELFWYAPGTATDYMWNFTSTTTVISKANTVNGSFRPTVGDYTGDGAEDIFWYAPGSAPDYMWEFSVGGSRRTVRPTVGRNFTPVSGSFGNDVTDDIMWYAPGTAPDYLWDFTPGTTSHAFTRETVNSTSFRPFSLDMWCDGSGSEDIFWYAPGNPTDWIWDFVFGGRLDYRDISQNRGHFLAAAGDFVPGGCDDIVWSNDDKLVLWEHLPTLERIEWGFIAAQAPELGSSGAAPHAPIPSGPAVKVGEQSIDRRP